MVAVHQPKDRSSSSQKWEEELEELQQKRKLENILLLDFLHEWPVQTKDCLSHEKSAQDILHTNIATVQNCPDSATFEFLGWF